MDLYNYDRLLGKMREKHITQAELAKKIGISATSMYFSFKNRRDFRQDEILSVCGFLDIPLTEIPAYFFSRVSLEN